MEMFRQIEMKRGMEEICSEECNNSYFSSSIISEVVLKVVRLQGHISSNDVQKEMPVKLIERTESQYRAKNRRKKN
jgi:hypothetical protein